MTAFLVSVEVSPDRPGGEIPARVSLRNLEALPRLQMLSERYGICPLYLMSYSALRNPKRSWFQSVRQSKRAELGLYYQSWATPPFEASENRLSPTSMSEMTAQQIQNKWQHLYDEFQSVFGTPASFVSAYGGGVAGATLQFLERAGIKADLSGRPGVDLTLQAGIDWRQAPRSAYHPSRQSASTRGHCPVLMLPLTTGSTWLDGLAGIPVDALIRKGGMAGRLIEGGARRLGQIAALDPAPIGLSAMQSIADSALAQSLPFVHMRIRSETLTPGTSRYSDNDTDTAKVLDKIDSFYRYAVDTLRLAPMSISAYTQLETEPSP